MTPTKDVSKFDYLRFRPFLLIESYYKPKKNVKTHIKGWWEDKASVDHVEVPSVVDRVNGKHLSRASVIIDVMNNKVIKNNLQNDDGSMPTAEQNQKILTHYTDKYSEIILQGVNRMVARR